jgi:hypothetical protein
VGAHKTSMLQDVEHGRALELQALVGAVIELGRITGVPTPTIEAIYAITGLLSRCNHSTLWPTCSIRSRPSAATSAWRLSLGSSASTMPRLAVHSRTETGVPKLTQA